jgi:flagellar biosynthetic protein FliP
MQSIAAELGSATPMRVVFILTALTLLPGIIVSTTAFLRIIVVLSFLRQALGVPQMPPNQVLIGLSLFLTWFVMGPVVEKIWTGAVTPYTAGQLSELEALDASTLPLREFMLAQTKDKDLALMLNLSESPDFEDPASVPLRVVVPAFILSELRASFAIGFMLFIPFLVIDMAVAAFLNALGMIMLPPTAIALPFKLLIFVLADGWALIVGALVKSFVR